MEGEKKATLSEKVNVPIECGDGWHHLIEPLVDHVNKVNAERAPEEQIEIVQIKEKFGGLRFYTHGRDEKLSQLIEEAERESYNTCEICGSTDDVGQTADGWITTMCRKCLQRHFSRKPTRFSRWMN